MLQKPAGNEETTIHKLEEYFIAKEWVYELNEGNVLWISITLENGHWDIRLEIDEDRNILAIHSLCPVKIKEHQKIRIAELITRINNTLLLGAFIFCMEDCLLSFRTIHMFTKSQLDLDSFEILLATNMMAVDDFLPAIIAVNSGYTEPVLAI